MEVQRIRCEAFKGQDCSQRLDVVLGGGAYQEEGTRGGVDVVHIEQVTGHCTEETQLLTLT